MASVGEQLVQAMCNALNAPASPPCTTFRTRIDAFATQELPAMVIFAIKETPEVKSANTVLRTRTVRLEILVAGEPPADSNIDPLYTYAVQTLQADMTLAPLIRKLKEASIQWETEASYQDATVAAVDFDVVFVTTQDPTVRVDL